MAFKVETGILQNKFLKSHIFSEQTTTLVKPKKTLIVLSILLIAAILGVLVVDSVIETEVKRLLKKEFGQEVGYEEVESNVFSGRLEISELSFQNDGFQVRTDTFSIDGFVFYDYFFKNKITIGQINLISPSFRIIKRDRLPSKEPDKKQEYGRSILIEVLSIKNGKLVYAQPKGTLLSVGNFDFRWGPISIADSTAITNPFISGNYSLVATDLEYDLVEHHGFGVRKISLSDQNFLFSEIWLRPKYSREEFRKIIPYEKDMYDLTIDSLLVENPCLRTNSVPPVFTSPEINFRGVDFEIYRDKTLPDDPRQKKMYSEMLRVLEMKLGIEKLNIDEAYIKYQERIYADRDLGRVEFYDLSAEIKNMTNIGMTSENSPKTKIDVQANFMNTSDLDVKWEFDISNKSDEFTMSGQSTKIPPRAMNPFFVPAMNIKSKGSIDELYFTIHGNQDDAQCNLKLVYEGFNVEVLKENGKGKKGMASFFANLILKTNSKNSSGTVQNVPVARDKTKSFWNFFWKCIYGGLKEAML